MINHQVKHLNLRDKVLIFNNICYFCYTVDHVESAYGAGIIPIYEGVALTNHAASTECGDRCAFTNKKMSATAVVRNNLKPAYDA